MRIKKTKKSCEELVTETFVFTSIKRIKKAQQLC